MKTVKLKSSIFAGACALLSLFPQVASITDSPLKEITKPYLGVYECRNAQLGGKDLLEDFSFIHLELKSKNECCLYYGNQEGKKVCLKGKYVYDRDKQTISLQFKEGKMFKREFPLKNGEIIISLPLANKQLCIIFQQK